MIVGITGKSGSGKHTAAKFFEQKGWKVLDADKIAHQLYKPYQRIWRSIVDRFGEGILTKDDIIDRQKLKSIVFGGTAEAKKALKDLNEIVHPELRRVLKDDIYYLRRKKANVILIGALWKELELFELCDVVILIKASEALAYERVRKRDGISFDTYRMVTDNQIEPKNADKIVTNEKTFRDFYKELNSVITQL